MNSEDDNKIAEDLRDMVLRIIPKLIADKAEGKRLVALDVFHKEASNAWIRFASAAMASSQFVLDDNANTDTQESKDLTCDAVERCSEIADLLLSEWKYRFHGHDEDSVDGPTPTEGTPTSSARESGKG